MTPELDALVGAWTTSATHPAFPGTAVTGRTTFEWLEGRHFLIGRSRNDHPDFPDALVVLGADFMRYYDSRGVERLYRSTLTGGVWRMDREAPGFSQRFEGRFGEGGTTIAGLWHLCEDGETWNADLEIVYRRVE